MQLLAYAACYSDITEPDRVCQFIELNETVKGNELSFSLCFISQSGMEKTMSVVTLC